MKFKIDQKEIKNMLLLTTKVNTSVTGNLLMESVYIDASKENNTISFLFFNEELKVLVKCINNFEIESSGKILIRTKILDSIISKLSDEPVYFQQLDSYVLTLTQNNFTCNINSLDPNLYVDFDLNNWPTSSTLEFNFNDFKEAVKKCLHCVYNKNDSNINITNNQVLSYVNVFTNKESNELWIQTSDSAKISKIKINCKCENDINTSLPLSLFNFIDSITEKEVNVKFEIAKMTNDYGYMYIGDNIKIKTSLNTTPFPDTSRVFNQDEKFKQFTINAKKMYDAVNRVINLTDSNVTFSTKLQFEDDKLIITAKSLELGDVKEIVNLISNTSDETLTMKFNARYLLSMLKIYGSNDIKLFFADNSDSLQRLIIKCNEDKNLTQVIAPLR